MHFYCSTFRNPSIGARVSLPWTAYKVRTDSVLAIDNSKQPRFIRSFKVERNYEYFNNFIYQSVKCIGESKDDLISTTTQSPESTSTLPVSTMQEQVANVTVTGDATNTTQVPFTNTEEQLSSTTLGV